MPETPVTDAYAAGPTTAAGVPRRRADWVDNLYRASLTVLAVVCGFVITVQVDRYVTRPAQPTAAITLLCTPDTADHGVGVELGDWRSGPVTVIAIGSPSHTVAPAGAVTVVPGQHSVYLGVLPSDDNTVTVHIAQQGKAARTVTRDGVAGLCTGGGAL